MKPGKLSMIIFCTILAIIVIVAASVVVRSYNENKPVTPDVLESSNLSVGDMEKIKAKYNKEESMKNFKEIADGIHLAVANRLLDGSVTTEENLSVEIAKLNTMFASNDWSEIKMKCPTFWIGTWHLDNTGRLSFKFKYDEIKPEWTSNKEVAEFIVK